MVEIALTFERSEKFTTSIGTTELSPGNWRALCGQMSGLAEGRVPPLDMLLFLL